MITEVAFFTAVPGKADELGQGILNGLEIIRQHPECVEARVERCIEQPEQYMLVNIWTSLEAHIEDFRKGPLFPQWRAHITGLFAGQPSVFHYQVLEKE
ncbi:MAG TPA: antibiotic biosynthesis monooxygenase family protein [Ktedonobacteraceae bacterium]